MLNSDLAGSTYEDAEHFFMADCQDLGEKVGKVRFLILIKFRKDLYTFLGPLHRVFARILKILAKKISIPFSILFLLS